MTRPSASRTLLRTLGSGSASMQCMGATSSCAGGEFQQPDICTGYASQHHLWRCEQMNAWTDLYCMRPGNSYDYEF